jgi:hypothetical protein
MVKGLRERKEKRDQHTHSDDNLDNNGQPREFWKATKESFRLKGRIQKDLLVKRQI